MNHSGVIGALLQYLTGGEQDVDSVDSQDKDAEGEGRAHTGKTATCEERLRVFLHVFADMPLVPELVYFTCFMYTVYCVIPKHLM